MKKILTGIVSVFALNAALAAVPVWADEYNSDTNKIEFADPEKNNRYKEVIRESVSAHTADGYKILLAMDSAVKKSTLHVERTKAAAVFAEHFRRLSGFCEERRGICDDASAFEKDYSYNKGMALARHRLGQRQQDNLIALKQEFRQQKKENKKWQKYCESKDFSCYEERPVKRALERTSQLHASIEKTKEGVSESQNQAALFEDRNKRLLRDQKDKHGESYNEFFELARSISWQKDHKNLYDSEKSPDDGTYFVWRFRRALINQLENMWQDVASRYSKNAIQNDNLAFVSEYRGKATQVIAAFESRTGITLKTSFLYGFPADVTAMVAKRRADPAFMKTLPSFLAQEEQRLKVQTNQPAN